MSNPNRIIEKALATIGGPRLLIAAVPGGINAIAREAGVSPGRVSQVLRMDPLPAAWASLIARLIGCTEAEVYEHLDQSCPVSPLGPLFDAKPNDP
jgi:hypothetical protein